MVLHLRVKRFIIVLLFGSLFTFTQASALHSQKKTSEERAKNLTERMKRELSLDDNQYSKVYDINLEYVKKSEQLQNSSAGRLSKLKTFRANQETQDKELKIVLTDVQYKKYQQLKERLKEEFKENRKNRDNF